MFTDERKLNRVLFWMLMSCVLVVLATSCVESKAEAKKERAVFTLPTGEKIRCGNWYPWNERVILEHCEGVSGDIVCSHGVCWSRP